MSCVTHSQQSLIQELFEQRIDTPKKITQWCLDHLESLFYMNPDRRIVVLSKDDLTTIIHAMETVSYAQ